MSELQRISDQLHRAYDGPAWHGPNVVECLQEVTPELALLRCGSSHNIAELTHHLYAWRYYVIQHLTGNTSYDVADDFNFIKYDEVDAKEWERLKQQLAASQQTLLQLLANQNDDVLEKNVPNRKFTFYVLLHGLIQHDLYHAGQIRMLQKNT
ncbi:MAG: DinB family protein [Saprospiraceae bacterium]